MNNKENITEFEYFLKKIITRKMKLIVMLLIISMFQVYGTDTYAQKTKIDLNLKNTTLKEVLKVIESKSEFTFFYNDNVVDMDRKVSVVVQNESVTSILDKILVNCTYTVEDRMVAIIPVEKQVHQSSTITVSGKVLDNIGEELIGVSVKVKDKPRGASTGLDGKYILDVESDGTLVFFYMGYKTLEVPINGKNTINVTLQPNDMLLDEVTVVGYGVQKKVSMIGSQSSVDIKDVKIPVRNLTNSLGGRVAGLVSVQTKGEPGFDDATIYIRGIATLSASMSKPLVLVDGVPRSFSDVDPEDIENFSLLKDASATAVYGVRGANGVILITTKTGKAGKPKFTVRHTEGVTTFTKLPSFADGATYMQMYNEGMTTRGEAEVYSQSDIDYTANGTDPYLYPDVDWFSELFNKTGHTRNTNINVSGGFDKAVYYIGLGYYDELGLYKTDDLVNYNSSIYYKRYSVTSNLTLKPTYTTTIKFGVQGYLANANYPATGVGTIFDKAFFKTPISIPPKYPDGKVSDERSGTLGNPYALLTQTGYANQWRNQLFSNLRITQDLPFITKGLSITGMFSFDAYNYYSARNTKTPDTWIATGRDLDGNLLYEQTFVGTEYLAYSKNNNGSRSIYGEFGVNYNRDFGLHSVSGMLLYNQSDEVNTQATTLQNSLPYRFMGVSGRSTYGYATKYFVEFNFGYNGSENFDPGNRFGFFPSGGLGWVISNESFFMPLEKIVQFAKLRLTYGLVGNSNINSGDRRFAYIPTVNDAAAGYNFGKDREQNYTGKAIGEYASRVSWETSKKFNLGIDFFILDNKLNIQMDYFNENREGIFLRRASLPDYTGITSAPYGNLGIVMNQGIDASMSYTNHFGDFYLNLLGNFTFNRNKVIENDQASYLYPWQERRGRKVGQRFGYIALGLFESDDEVAASAIQVGDTRAGDIRYKDINGDGKIDSYDKLPIGYGSVPEMIYGFGFTFGYKSVSISTLFQGSANVDAMLSGEGMMPFSQGSGRGNLFSNITDRWTESNPDPNAFYPRLMIGTNNMNYEASTWWLKKTDYLRLKTLQLNYSLPEKWTKAAGLGSASIFFQGVNVLTLSSFDLWDVELGDGKGATYPNIGSYSFGFNFTF